MFTGIIAAVGKISRVESGKGGLRLAIDAGELGLSDLKIGDSVAVNGVCLTVVKRGKKSFSVDVSRETLRCTAGLDQAGEVNLEKALRFSDSPDGPRSRSRRRRNIMHRIMNHEVVKTA